MRPQFHKCLYKLIGTPTEQHLRDFSSRREGLTNSNERPARSDNKELVSCFGI